VNLFDEAMMVMRSWICMVMVALGVTLVLIQAADAQTESEAVELTVRLRAGDGSAVAGEAVTLQRLPHEETVLPECVTGEQGTCTWLVGRGLYQVMFDRPLDEVSALALAEGGLRGFGLTVGDVNITYHFTLQGDGHVYFDATPMGAIPSSIIPTLEALHGGMAPADTPEPTPESDPVALDGGDGAEEMNDGSPADEGEDSASARRRRLLFLAGMGLMAGSSLHLWTRRRRKTDRASIAASPVDEAAERPTDRATDDHHA
jgi:hypothetical protein